MRSSTLNGALPDVKCSKMSAKSWSGWVTCSGQTITSTRNHTRSTLKGVGSGTLLGLCRENYFCLFQRLPLSTCTYTHWDRGWHATSLGLNPTNNPWAKNGLHIFKCFFNQKNNISWYVKTTWHLHFSAINKVLLEYSHAHSFAYHLWLLSLYGDRVQ